VQFLIHRDVTARAPRALAWVKAFFSQFDTSEVGWLRIDFGREYRDRRGRLYHKYRGVYGRCWYPSARQPKIRISCQVPGPFPCDIVTRKTPVYRNADGTWPAAARLVRGPVFENARSGRQWKRVYGRTEVRDLDEAIIWIIAHEAFHWLRKTGQIPGRNTEIEADAFADRKLAEFRDSLPAHRPSEARYFFRGAQGEFWEGA
jgi:hypothetical protein